MRALLFSQDSNPAIDQPIVSLSRSREQDQIAAGAEQLGDILTIFGTVRRCLRLRPKRDKADNSKEGTARAAWQTKHASEVPREDGGWRGIGYLRVTTKQMPERHDNGCDCRKCKRSRANLEALVAETEFSPDTSLIRAAANPNP